MDESHTHTHTRATDSSYLSHHPIPDVVDFLAMLAIGYQVQVIGELHILCNLLQNIDAEAFAALLDVCPTSLCCVASETQTNTTLTGDFDQQLFQPFINCGSVSVTEN